MCVCACACISLNVSVEAGNHCLIVSSIILQLDFILIKRLSVNTNLTDMTRQNELQAQENSPLYLLSSWFTGINPIPSFSHRSWVSGLGLDAAETTPGLHHNDFFSVHAAHVMLMTSHSNFIRLVIILPPFENFWLEALLNSFHTMW